MPVEFSPTLPVDPRSIRLRMTARVLGFRPETFALLSTLDPMWWQGTRDPMSWIIEDGKITIVTPDEAEKFFRDKASKRKAGR